MYIYIFFLLIIIFFLFNKRFGLIGCFLIVLIGYSISLIDIINKLYILYFYKNLTKSIPIIDWWISLNSVKFNFCLVLDYLGIVMAIVVILISFGIQIYTFYYLSKDESCFRFIIYLLVFTLFMLILVTALNLLTLFVGWEGVGISSYLLINFWDKKISANQASIKAILLNKIGDLALLSLIFVIYYYYQTVDIYNLNILYNFINLNKDQIFGFFLIVAVISKSAQLWFASWLLEAMEGPTPASALIHSATMVAAGIYLLIRLYFIISLNLVILNIIVVIAVLSIFIATFGALSEYDIKKLIAQSTVSQLGYMFLACSFSQYISSFYLMYTHSICKALLFLLSGGIIHAINNEQDIRKMGGLYNQLVIIYIMFMIGSLTLIGFFFSSMHFSKDFLFLSVTNLNLINYIILFLIYISAILGVIYMLYVIYIVFLAKSNVGKLIQNKIINGSDLMLIPLVVFTSICYYVGYNQNNLIILNLFSNDYLYNNNYIQYFLCGQEIWCFSGLLISIVIIIIIQLNFISYFNFKFNINYDYYSHNLYIEWGNKGLYIGYKLLKYLDNFYFRPQIIIYLWSRFIKIFYLFVNSSLYIYINYIIIILFIFLIY